MTYSLAGPLGANSVARAAFRRRLLVLCFHGVCGARPDIPDPDGIHVPVPLFEEQLRSLVQRYTPVSLRDVKRHVLLEAPLPAGAVLVTFDDGYRNVVRNAVPVLQRYEVPAVVFPVPGAMDEGRWLWPAELEWRHTGDLVAATMKRRLKVAPADERRRALATEFAEPITLPECDSSLMDWADLKALVDEDLVAIGSHGLYQEPLQTCEPDEVRSELAESRRRLTDELGIEIDTIAYGDGSASSDVAAAAWDAGYRLGFTTVSRHVRPGDDPMLLPRVLVGARDSVPVLAARLSGWTEWVRAVAEVSGG